MTAVYGNASALTSSDASAGQPSRLPPSSAQSSLAAQFRNLLADGSDDRVAQEKHDAADLGSEALARLILRNRPASADDAADAQAPLQVPARTSAQKSSAGEAQDKAATRTTPSRENEARPREHSASDAAGVGIAVSMPAASAMQATQLNTATTSSATAQPAASLGELAQLLSEQCQGVYVGLGAAGEGVGRVMLKLGGAMTGVSAEIVSTAAGLAVRMHVRDHDKWAEVAARKGELEQLLSAASALPVRIEPVFEGGRS